MAAPGTERSGRYYLDGQREVDEKMLSVSIRVYLAFACFGIR